MLIIQDEKIANRIRDIAAREQKPVEQVIEAMANQYLQKAESEQPVSDPMKRIHQLMYRDAREFWEEEANTERLALTLAQVVEQLAYFEENGKPVFKEEVPPDREDNSLAALARKHSFRSGQPDLAARVDEIAAEMGSNYERSIKTYE